MAKKRTKGHEAYGSIERAQGLGSKEVVAAMEIPRVPRPATDDDMDVDGDDKWYHNVYDERWRKLATYRESDNSPKEEFLPHQAGLGGFGGSSYINALVCRWKDANTAWTSASDGTLEETVYYCQNWRGDVSSLISNSGAMLEWAKYSAYGVPFGLPGGDTDSDGDCDSTDVTQIQTWIDAPAYDVRGDIDLDGDVDATDKSTVQGSYEGATTGWEVLSAAGNRAGYAGYMLDGNGLWHVRYRVLDPGLGRWLRRDPLGYVDGLSLVEYVSGRSVMLVDPLGLDSGVDRCWHGANEGLFGRFGAGPPLPPQPPAPPEPPKPPEPPEPDPPGGTSTGLPGTFGGFGNGGAWTDPGTGQARGETDLPGVEWFGPEPDDDDSAGGVSIPVCTIWDWLTGDN